MTGFALSREMHSPIFSRIGFSMSTSFRLGLASSSGRARVFLDGYWTGWEGGRLLTPGSRGGCSGVEEQMTESVGISGRDELIPFSPAASVSPFLQEGGEDER